MNLMRALSFFFSRSGFLPALVGLSVSLTGPALVAAFLVRLTKVLFLAAELTPRRGGHNLCAVTVPGPEHPRHHVDPFLNRTPPIVKSAVAGRAGGGPGGRRGVARAAAGPGRRAGCRGPV